jgi:integrase
VAKRSHGDGGIDQRGEGIYRLRYRVGAKRYTVTFHGTLKEARKRLRDLLGGADKGEHVAPDKITVGKWIGQWIETGAPGRKKKKVGQRTIERYEQLLNTHVTPVLGEKQLQQLRAADIDKLYTDIDAARKIAPRTQHHVHVVFSSCLATAYRKGMLVTNPMLRVEKVPDATSPVLDDDRREDDIGEGLDETELATLIAGFTTSSLYPVVALAAATGARRNELLALRWTDIDFDEKTIRIDRAWEQTKMFGLRLKPPKTRRGLRTIEVDDSTITVLRCEKARCQRIMTGVPDGVEVDLSLVQLADRALVFPALPEPGADYDITKPRNPRNFSKEFARKADRLGFGRIRFHDLRGIHSTALLDAGIPVHTVAQRIGDDPAILLRNYAKRKRSITANASMASAIAALASTFLGK